MSWSDPIADMLTRIRNAQSAGLESTDMPYSKLKAELARVLKDEGFIADNAVEGEGVRKVLRVFLKYKGEQEPVIQGIRRLSRPGRRQYAASDKLPKVLNGLGVAIVSTSQGLMTDKRARKMNLGGEILCSVW